MTILAAFDLTGDVAVVTGGAMGIGAAISAGLAECGATVVIADREVAAGEQRAAELSSGSATVEFEQVDITSEASVEDLFARVRARHGPPSILVNNAGLQSRSLLLETSADEWDAMHRVNLRGAFLCLREAARGMGGAGRPGRIVNIASLGVRLPIIAGLGPYSASKAGVDSLTRNAAFEFAERGVRVNAVMPGGVPTPGALNSTGPAPSGAGVRESPLGTCTPEDIAGAVLFLVSGAAARITGQSIVVDAGYLMT
jgi:NAD(P)-dependent dehydrogenase (short-subunit alcohol dehydrogenase family)